MLVSTLLWHNVSGGLIKAYNMFQPFFITQIFCSLSGLFLLLVLKFLAEYSRGAGAHQEVNTHCVLWAAGWRCFSLALEELFPDHIEPPAQLPEAQRSCLRAESIPSAVGTSDTFSPHITCTRGQPDLCALLGWSWTHSRAFLLSAFPLSLSLCLPPFSELRVVLHSHRPPQKPTQLPTGQVTSTC